MALRSADFVDALDPRFMRIFDEYYTDLPDLVERFFAIESNSKLQTERYSSIGTIGEIPEFTGTVTADEVYQGYDTSITALEYARLIEIERRLIDDSQTTAIERKPKALASALYRLRQTHAARPFNQAFNVDTQFGNNSEAVSLCSNSHTTTSGAPTTVGFDNQVLTAFNATALESGRITMVDFRGDRAERIDIMPSLILARSNLYGRVYEVIASEGKTETADNDRNVHYGQYTFVEWNYLDDSNDWYLIDEKMMKDWGLIWVDKNKGEFAFIEDFERLIGRWRVYARWGNHWLNWRWILGAQVS